MKNKTEWFICVISPERHSSPMASGSDGRLKTCLSISGLTSSLQDVISTVIFFASPFPLACLQKALSHSLRLSKLSKLKQCLWLLFWSLIRKDWKMVVFGGMLFRWSPPVGPLKDQVHPGQAAAPHTGPTHLHSDFAVSAQSIWLVICYWRWFPYRDVMFPYIHLRLYVSIHSIWGWFLMTSNQICFKC